jgi:putative component of membrane protein insertase Oxa1/YidC/SpoIIIJ protein YidD
MIVCSTFKHLPLLLLTIGFFSMIFSVSNEEHDEIFDSLCGMLLEGSSDVAEPARLPIVLLNEESEFRMVSQAMIRMYQEFVSSQQTNVCVFEPSWSHFGQEAIQRYGLVKGVLLTADRLQRCNNFASQYRYGYDQTTGRLLDPVINYQFRDLIHDSLSRSRSGAIP